MVRRHRRTNKLFGSVLSFLIHLNLAAALEESIPTLHQRLASLSRRAVEQKDRRFFKFITRPDIDVPTWKLEVHDEDAIAPGYWFVAPYQELDQGRPGDAWVGPHIYDGEGQLIWSGSAMFRNWNAFDFEMTTINGEQMMTILFPHGHAGVVLDSNYRVWKHVPLDGVKADMHAFRVIDNGSRALVITHDHVETTPAEAAVVGFNDSCSVAAIGFAELDVNNPAPPIFTWRSYRHVGLDEVTFNTDRVYEECTHNWDIMHVNAIDKFPDGDYLISARHTDTLYKISHVDGSIVWRLGGVKSDFEFLGPGNAEFSRQHHALVRSQDENRTIISLFDNAVGTGPSEHATNKEARGLILSLDTEEMTAGIVAEYNNPKGHTVSSRGSFQILPNGNAFICWTYSSHISEHAPNGDLIMEAILPVQAHSYRAFKYPWIGRPTQPPDVVSEAIQNKRNETHTMVYVSWNGATEVISWHLHEAHPNGEIENKTLLSADRDGFETMMTYEGVAEYVAVEALDIRGISLGWSEVIRTIPLEEQGLNQYHHLSFDKTEMEIYIKHAASTVKSLGIPFGLGFASCAVIGALLHWSSKRKGVLWRTSIRRGPKYELLPQERLQ